MSDSYQSIVAAALALPETERVKLVERMLESLPPEDREPTPEEFVDELDRRYAEFQKDPTLGIPWDKLKRKL